MDRRRTRRSSRATSAKKQRDPSLIPRTLRPETPLVSRSFGRDSESLSGASAEDVPKDSDEDVPEETDEINDNPATDTESGYVHEKESHSESGSEDSTLSHSEEDTKSVENTKTEDGPGEPLVDPAPENDLVRPFRQKVSSTISGDRSRGSQYEQLALYLKALQVSHPATRKSQSELPSYETGWEPVSTEITPLEYYQRELLRLEHQERKRAMDARNGLPKYYAQNTTKVSMENGNLPSSSSDSDTRHQETHMGEDLIGSIADALGIPSESAASLDTLKAYISNLQQHNGSKTLLKSERYQIIHRVGSRDERRLYLDRPQCLEGEDTSQRVIAGMLPVSNLASYLSKHVGISFIVFRDYDAISPNDRGSSEDYSDIEPWLEHSAETVTLVRKGLANTFNRFLEYTRFDKEKGSDDPITLKAPYLAIYQNRHHAVKEFVATLDVEHQPEFRLLISYILDNYSQEWDEVEKMIMRGKITQRYIKYLFKPGELVVQEGEQGIRGYLATSWLEGPQNMTVACLRQPWQNTFNSSKTQRRMEYDIRVSSWEFDGSFSNSERGLVFQLEQVDDRELEIAHLGVRPLTHSSPKVQQKLQNRGLMFWKCRVRHFVSYHEDPERTSHHSGDDRYMIDTSMYQELRKRQSEPTNTRVQSSLKVGRHDLGRELMDHDEPPSDRDFPGFIYMMPITIKGFNLKSKKWLDLKVDNIGEVVWNDEAFKSLVLKEKTKDLIQALISNQIEAEKSTDLISGKGNGLIMLLHGGPGTGKTLTAESVAEIARKPLYPVTCGDIGTEAEQVEDYLESVLYIGKTWGCVVLLDEADVFLQERNLKDLKRNALVSVFLRVLEYYDGILVLTSNRVGHFDAAFKSRIQLAIRYQTLNENQRTQIWGSFIRRLQSFNDGDIDVSDLVDHIPELAKNRMNGREIRNAITTARQFAKWKRQCPGSQNRQLDYPMMQEIIDISGEFDKYLEDELYEGNSLEQLARERLDH